MLYLDEFDRFHMDEPSAITLGKFDGLHKGHALLIEQLQTQQKKGLKAVAFTFSAPPGQASNQVLTTNEEKRRLFEQAGIDCLLQCPVTPQIMGMEPDDFVEWMVKCLQVRCIIVGSDFRFGHQRAGDCRMLSDLSGKYGYELIVIPKIQYENRDISSSFIRQCISDGQLELANRLMGHPYEIGGTVISGNRLGRTIGVPTANLAMPEEKLAPVFGVYASTVAIDGSFYQGISNIGRKPTVAAKDGSQNPVGLEIHIFDFDRDIYGKQVTVFLHRYLRPERKFGQVEDLLAQIKRDIAKTKAYFGE